MDEDGYPTEETLEKIRTWEIKTGKDWTAAFDYIESLWMYPEYFRKGKRRTRAWKGGPLERTYEISTGGWSGHESIISAMEENFMLWVPTWSNIRRGGHYTFRVAESA
jgi:hypothetical protein